MSAGLIRVVERAYEADASEREWLDSIRRAAEGLFANQVAAQAFTFSLSEDRGIQFGEVASEPLLEEVMRRCHQAADPALVRRGYLKGPVTTPDTWLVPSAADPGIRLYIEDFARQGLQALTANGIDPSGHGCSLAIIRQHAAPLSRRERGALARIAAHLACARRLRRVHGGSTESESKNGYEAADAVLSADGSTLHAQGDARSADVRAALCDAARRIDRARMRSAAESPEEALALWRALVEGRWSLVERFDSDGRRLFVARRNDPASRAHHALEELERKVVALLALGHAQKLCAYELGRSESTVSALARSAFKKLGVRSRAELVELYGALHGSGG